MQLPARNRQDYVPIIKRNDYTWPCGSTIVADSASRFSGAGVATGDGGGPAALPVAQWELDARPADTGWRSPCDGQGWDAAGWRTGRAGMVRSQQRPRGRAVGRTVNGGVPMSGVVAAT